MKPIILSLLFCFCLTPIFAQYNIVEDDEGEKHAEHETFKKHHRISAMMAFSNIPQIIPGKENREVIAVPTWGLNYDFWFRPKWGVGLHNDIILLQYTVERHHGHDELIRSYPLGVKLVGLFQPIHDLIFLTGYGKEIEPNETLDILTVGVEYGFPIRNGWESNINLSFDWIVNNYISFMLGIGFAKKL